MLMKRDKRNLLKKMARIFGNETNLKIILSLDESRKQSFSELKRSCVACSPSINYSLTVLIAEGLIERIEKGKKKKKVYYELTEYGKKCVDVIRKFLSIRKNH